MGVTGISTGTTLTLQSALDMRDRLNDLQRQLGTGKLSTSYAGLGLDRGLTIGLRSQLNSISGYQETITQVGVRLELMQTALSQVSSIAQQVKGLVLGSEFKLNGDTQTLGQKTSAGMLELLVASLDTNADGRYLFSGRTVDQVPVETTDHILNGDGLKAGLKQIIDERKQADLGASGLGRLVISGPGPTQTTLTEDAVSPFGFKLVGAVSTVPGVVVTGPVGAPAALTVDLAGPNPSVGETVRFTFTLPDGTSRDLTLTATASTSPKPGEFTIGATPTLTATNLQAALTLSLGTLANTELVAASAVAAGNDFFNTDASNPPQRVGGPPFNSATTLVNGTAVNTVDWYLGDDATDDPRSTAVARVDQSLTVAYGARANEQALRFTVQSIAVYAAVTYSAVDPNAAGQDAALRDRLYVSLIDPPNQQHVSDIGGELAGAQIALKSSKERHIQTNSALQNLLQSVEGVTPEEVGVQILALQARLQATLQTTAMLLQTNLLNYL